LAAASEYVFEQAEDSDERRATNIQSRMPDLHRNRSDMEQMSSYIYENFRLRVVEITTTMRGEAILPI
jgi:hypothetical protein